MKRQFNDKEWGSVAKYLAGETSENEEAEFYVSVAADNEYEEAFDEATETWERASYVAAYNSIDAEKAYGKVMATIKKSEQRFSIKTISLSIAATMLVLISVGTWLFFNSDELKKGQQIVFANLGVESLTLSDGSLVTLNHSGKLSFPENFGAETRNVNLEGEAFFKVKSNANSPFIVDAGKVKVRVLGTSFNVKSDLSNGKVEVTVKEGVVEVSSETDVVTLRKEQVAVFDTKTGLISKQEVVNVNYDAWKTKEIVFREAEIDEVLSILEDVYHVSFQSQSVNLQNAKWTATFNKKDADYVAEVFAKSFNLKVKKSSKGYLFE